MKKWFFISIAAVLLTTCQKPTIEMVDFDSFQVTSVKYSDVIVDGALNPEIRTMELGDVNAGILPMVTCFIGKASLIDFV